MQVSIKTSNKKVVPIIAAMYGSSAEVTIKSRGPFGCGNDHHRKSYYGISAGAGLDIQKDRTETK